jgi:hypothetical protein
VKLDYIESGAPDGPLLRLAGDEPDVVRRLIQVLRGIGATSADLCAVAGIEPVGGVRLLVSESKADLGVRRAKDGSFVWSRDREGWAEVIDLLAPFAGARIGGSGFQYLSREGSVAVIISSDGRW